MKKTTKSLTITLAGILCSTVFSGCSASSLPSGNDGEKLSICASFYAMADFAEKIGGDKVVVTNMVKSGEEPHDWEPTAKDIVGLENADIFVYSGVGFEHWTEDTLKALQNKELLVVTASEGIETIAGHTHEHEEGEEHDEATHEESGEHEEDEDHGESGIDPHTWLSPLNAKIQMENIKNALVSVDSENKNYYEENFTKYAAELDKLDKEYKDTLSALPNKKIIVSHEAFGYLCNAYGLEQHGVDGLSPESEPSPARVAEIIDLVNNENIKVIFFEELVSSKIADSIATQTGAKTDVLSTIEGLTEDQLSSGSDYFSVMRENLEALKNALS